MHQLTLGLTVLVAITTNLSAQSAALASRQQNAERSVKLGARLVLSENVTLTVVNGSSRSREAFGDPGKTGLVIDLQFEAKSHTTLHLEPSTDAAESWVLLANGNEKAAPVALASYLAQRGDRIRPVRVTEMIPIPKTERRYFSWVAFTGTGIVSLLFDAAPPGPGATLILAFELDDEVHRLRVSL